MSSTAFNFTDCLNQAWEIYKKHLLLLVGATLVAIILTSVSFGILTGPLTAGLVTLIFKLMDEDSGAKFEDIFSQFGTFTTTFLLCLAWSAALYIAVLILMIIPLVGHLAVLLLSIGFSVFLTFAVLQAALKGMDFITASKSALGLLKANLWPLIGYTALAQIFGGIGSLACGIGAVFTMPMFFLMLATAYRSCAASAPAEEILLDPVPPPPPAPGPAPEQPAEPEAPAEPAADAQDASAEPGEEPDKYKSE
jgi:hypothetical protein